MDPLSLIRSMSFIQILIENRNTMRQNKFTSKVSGMQHKQLELNYKEHAVQLDATQKYQKFKKSASMPAYYLNQARLKKITEIYRTLSSGKLRLHSESKSLRKSHGNTHTPEKKSAIHSRAINPVNINSFLDGTTRPKKKLTIEKGYQNQPPSTYNDSNGQYIQLIAKMKNFKIRFEDMLQMRSDENFLNQFQKLCQSFNENNNEARSSSREGREQIKVCIKAFNDCCGRRERLRISEAKKNYGKFEQQCSNLQVQLKKKSIRAILDRKDIEKYQQKLKQAENSLQALKKQLNIKKASIGVNTVSEDVNQINHKEKNEENNMFMPSQMLTLSENTFLSKKDRGVDDAEQLDQKLSQCLKKIKMLNQRQRQLLSVLVVLRQEGVDVERIYNDVISGKISATQQQNQRILQSTNKMKKNENKMYKKCKKIKLNNSIDADNSIISDAEGLSFNYDGKSLDDDAYTVRNQYICQQDLGNTMKQQLKLDFNVFYEQIYEDEEPLANAPTF